MPLWVALVGVLLVSPSLFIGFHLDDDIHRYMLSDLPGGADLYHAYESPFGIANGDPDTNHWQIEQGLAPYWIYPDLHVSLYRPLSELSHRLDVALWFDNAFLMHLHSLLWFGLLLYATAQLYRAAMPRFGAVAGFTALLFAIDYNHGFAVGWIANRNAIIAGAFGVLALWTYVRSAPPSDTPDDAPSPASGPTDKAAIGLRLLSALCLGAGLLAGEGTVAAFAYLLGYAVFVQRGSALARALSLTPHLLVLIAWRLVYNALGRGAVGSGMYVDAVATPARFLQLLPERLPLLVNGQLLLPPPELAALIDPPWPSLMLGLSWFVLGLCLVTLIPMLLRDRLCRFWAFGAGAALVIGCSTYPHSRLLLFAGIGMLPLLTQIWHGLLTGAAFMPAHRLYRAAATLLTAGGVGVHLFVSPILLPIAACSVVFAASPIEQGLTQLVARSDADADLIVLTAPEYFFVKMLPVVQALAGRSGPRRLRALGFGPVETTVTAIDAHTLELHYDGGILQDTFSALYRDPQLPMRVGDRVRLDGLDIEVTAVTTDGRVERARARFALPLSSPELRFVHWQDGGFVDLPTLATGDRHRLPSAPLKLAM